MDVSGFNTSAVNWREAINQVGSLDDQAAKKTQLLQIIEQLGTAVQQGRLAPYDLGKVVWKLLKVAKPLHGADYAEIVTKINEGLCLIEPEDQQKYHASGWRVKESRLLVRADELKVASFRDLLSQNLTEEVATVLIQGAGEDVILPKAVAQELVKDRHHPDCFQHTLHCKVEGDTEIELSEALVRTLFPSLAPALDGDYAVQGTVDQPLNLNVSIDQLQAAKRYIASMPRPVLADLSATEFALLLDLFDYGGNEELTKELSTQLEAYFEENDRKYSPEVFSWFGELYASTSQPNNLSRLEGYFGKKLLRAVVTWNQVLNPKGRFPSMKALAAGAEPVTRKKLSPEEVPVPDFFAHILGVLKETGLSRLVIELSPLIIKQTGGPQWFWKGIQTLQGVPEVVFRHGKACDNQHCREALEAMSPKPRLVFLDQAACDLAKKHFGDKFEIVLR